MAQERDAARLKKVRERLSLSQEAMADKLGVKRSAYSHYENGKRTVPYLVKEALAGIEPPGEQFGAAAGELEIPIPSIGTIGACSKVEWTDPFENEEMVYVPGHMADGRGRFACIASGDSMMPLVQPGDKLVWQRTDVPKIGAVVLFRSFDNTVTIKTLRHDGSEFQLEPMNKAYATERAEGSMLGYLVGVYRKIGKRVMTDFDDDGIRP